VVAAGPVEHQRLRDCVAIESWYRGPSRSTASDCDHDGFRWVGPAKCRGKHLAFAGAAVRLRMPGAPYLRVQCDARPRDGYGLGVLRDEDLRKIFDLTTA